MFVFTAHGCSGANNSITLGDWRDPFDPDLDVQVIFSQFWLAKDQIKTLADTKCNDGTSGEDDRVFVSPSHDACEIAGSRNTEYHEVVSNGYIPSVYVKGYMEHHADVTSSTPGPHLTAGDLCQKLFTVTQKLEDEHLKASAPSTPNEIP